jgi:hypothetical protein
MGIRRTACGAIDAVDAARHDAVLDAAREA